MTEVLETSNFLSGDYVDQHEHDGEHETHTILTKRWSSIANAQEACDVRLCIKVSLVFCITKIHDWRCHVHVYNCLSAHQGKPDCSPGKVTNHPAET